MKLDTKTPKRPVKQSPEEPTEGSKQTDKIIASFKNSLGLCIGTLELPLETTPLQLQEFVNTLLKDIEAEDYEPHEFTFFHQER